LQDVSARIDAADMVVTGLNTRVEVAAVIVRTSRMKLLLRQFRSEWESFHGECASTRGTVVFSRSTKRSGGETAGSVSRTACHLGKQPANLCFDCAPMPSECALISCEARLSQVAQSGVLLRVHSLDSARKGWGPHLLCVALQEVRDFRAITVTHLA
jgi:hypothetical protein